MWVYNRREATETELSVDINRLIKFIEKHSTAGELHMVVPISNGGHEEIVWRRADTGRPWAIRSMHAGASWWRYAADQLAGALERRSVCLSALEEELVAIAQPLARSGSLEALCALVSATPVASGRTPAQGSHLRLLVLGEV